MSKAKIELVAPASGAGPKRKRKSFTPPYNLAVLASLTPDDFEVFITDDELQSVDFDKKIDLAGITVQTPNALRAYEIADRFRARGVTVVLGGIHPSFLPDEAAVHADVVVIGEAEALWPRLLKDFCSGQLKKLYKCEKRPDLVGLPAPRTDLFNKKWYVVPNQVSVSRGCPFSCAYCIVTSFFGGTQRFRPIEEVIAEIELLKDQNRRRGFPGTFRMVNFLDDNIIGQPAYSRKLLQALIPLRIKWIGQAPITIAKDDELLELASKSGCCTLFIGLESLDQENLDSIGKKINRAAEYERAIRKIHSYGVAISAGFMFGFDHDDESVFEKTVRFAQRLKLETADFNILTPYPGTEIHRELEEAGRIITRDWSKYDCAHALFRPRLISAEVLEKGTHWAAMEFYKTAAIFRRARLSWTNFHYYWVMNLGLKAFYRSKALRTGAKKALNI